jgi:hypothetical protein
MSGSLSIGDVTITEGNAGTQIATFTVVRSGGTTAFTVDFATADGSATAGSDYAATSGTLSFGDGVSTQTISVSINGDTTFEPNETFLINLSGATNSATITDGQGVGTIINDDQGQPFDPLTIANDHLGITRTVLPFDEAIAVAQAIDQFETTEAQFVNDLLVQVANTTIPAVAVEGSMYGAVGSSDEITKLATVFLPGQVENALKNGYDPQVYACEALGLAFAFSDENGGTAFAEKFGPSAPGMSATPAGDAFFVGAAATAIFGTAATAATPGVILDWVSNWVDFYTSHGIPGLSNPTDEQIHLVARGAAWGDAVGVALANNLGLLPGQTTNFLECAAQGSAVYGASLANQPVALPLQGEGAPVQLLGIAQQVDQVVM